MLALALAGCGAADESLYTLDSAEFDESSGPAAMTQQVEAEAQRGKAFAASAGSDDYTEPVTEESAAEFEEAEEFAGEGDGVLLAGSSGLFQNAPLTGEGQPSVQTQNRIIVRTVDMGIGRPDVPEASDAVLAMTRQAGGWQVSSDRSRTHRALLAVRVPAEKLDEFVDSIRDLAERVEYETSTSQDVTDEYVDNEARLNGLRKTEERLLEFLARAADVRTPWTFRRRWLASQLEIEAIEGRLRFLSQTAAYSLVNLSLTTRPGEMAVEIGEDAATYRAGLSAGFRATFEAPEGVEEFTYTWDFGDGTNPVQGSRTAPTTNAGERVTATVVHTFYDIEQSPYIVQLEITGFGEEGVFQGSDTLIANGYGNPRNRRFRWRVPGRGTKATRWNTAGRSPGQNRSGISSTVGTSATAPPRWLTCLPRVPPGQWPSTPIAITGATPTRSSSL